MPTKFQFITELYRSTLAGLTNSYESWTGFLCAACYNYKCPFDEQVLIYAQRPNATAVLELEKWNRQFGRWVNAGATGIAVMDEAHGKGRLKHYFDITDTHATRISRPVPIWSMEPAYTEPVIETLEATFGTLSEKDNLPDAILSASRNAVADNVPDYLRDLLDCRDGSMLEELDMLNAEVTYRRALQSSVAYMLMTRLSLPAMAYLLPEDFEGIYSYGIDVLKQFSDNGGKVQNVKFLLHNDTDDVYVIAEQKDGVYYAKGFAAKKADATTFVPNAQGHVVVKGLEDDTYSLTETATDKGYILLKEAVKIVIKTSENGACEQCGAKLLTATGTVNGKDISTTEGNAIVPLTVINNPGFDLPKTGGYGTWMFTIGGVALLGVAAFIVVKSRKRNEQ